MPTLFADHTNPGTIIMGRGDKRTKKGKIFAGSYGKTRPRGGKKTTAAPAAAPKKGKG